MRLDVEEGQADDVRREEQLVALALRTVTARAEIEELVPALHVLGERRRRQAERQSNQDERSPISAMASALHPRSSPIVRRETRRSVIGSLPFVKTKTAGKTSKERASPCCRRGAAGLRWAADSTRTEVRRSAHR